MVTINLNLSGSAFYKFTDPIRKFKSNDPYYYEVDNIPIKQLEENILWLKDAIQNATIDVDDQSPVLTGGGSRDTFTELQPYVSGFNSNVVSVRSGRYIGRVNDAYDLTPLQIIKRISGFELGDFHDWDVATIDNIFLAPTLQKFKSSLAVNSLSMNGLAERSFGSFLMTDINIIGATESDGVSPVYSLFNINGANPNFSLPAFLWGGSPKIEVELGTSGSDNGLRITQFGSSNNTQGAGGFFQLLHADTQFIKKWRGVARTAVVDVPSDLSIEIDKFYSDDFTYTDESEGLIDSSIPGSPAALATQRIDLLFIYSKPVDSAAVHLNTSWTNEVPRKIYKAELGIVRGAGLNINYFDGLQVTSKFARPNYEEAIMAQYADELNENLGFKSLDIKGSFPAPDDLMNIAPALAEWLPRTHYALVGQSILPIAYIVVKKDKINENGDQIIEPNDIIDIRPFFRTTELTYGERAGIAAALPAPSLANPVATEGYVVYENNRMRTYVQATEQNIYDYINTRVNVAAGGMGSVIARGVVRGGNYYGPEGAICRAIQKQYNLPKALTITKFKELHNLPESYEFKNLPDWDLATWTYQNISGTTTSFPSIGFGITDRWNHAFAGIASSNQYFYGHTDTAENNNNTDFGPFNSPTIEAGKEKRMFGGPLTTITLSAQDSYEYWATKTITLDITNTPWVKDITVLTNFWNCAPLAETETRMFVSKGPIRGPIPVTQPNGPPVNKFFIDFTIFLLVPPQETLISLTYTERYRRRRGLFRGRSRRTRTVTQRLNTAIPFYLRDGAGGKLGGYFYALSHCMLYNASGDPWITSTERQSGFGGVPLPEVFYPSVEFTVIGHPLNYTLSNDVFPNGLHKVPGINDHENYNSDGRLDRPVIEASLTPPTGD